MSTNKKFRVQNGIDITGEVTVGGVTVINADGTVVSDVSDQLVPLQSSVSALETSVQNIIGTSPETLDTLQEICQTYNYWLHKLIKTLRGCGFRFTIINCNCSCNR